MALVRPPANSDMAVPAWTNPGGPTSGAATEKLDFPQSRIVGGIKDWEALGGYNGEDILIQGATPIKRDIEAAAAQVGASLEEVEADFDDINGHPEYAVHIYSQDRGIDIMAFLPEQFSTGVSASYDSLTDILSGLPFAGAVVNTIEKVGQVARLGGIAPTIQPMTAQIWRGSDPITLTLPLVFLLDNDSEQDILSPLRQILSLTMPRLYTSTSGADPNVGKGMILQAPGPKYVIKRDNSPPGQGDRAKGAAERAGETADGILSSLVSKVVETANAFKNVWDGASSDAAITALSGAFGSMGFDNLEIKDNLVVRCGEFFIIPSAIVTNVDQDWSVVLDRHSKRPIALTLAVTFQSWVTPKADDLDVIIPRA